MRLEDLRRGRQRELTQLQRAIDVIDEVMADQPRRRGSDSSVLIQALPTGQQNRLLRALYRSGSSLEELRLTSKLTKERVRQAVGSAVVAPDVLDPDPDRWADALDSGSSVSVLARQSGCSVSRMYEHLRRVEVWPRPWPTFSGWLDRRTRVVGAWVIWTGELTTQDQPMATWHGRTATVRRLVWEQRHGVVQDGFYVTAIRDCPEPRTCVALDHSRLLPPHEASLERAAAGRVPRGEQHGGAKLTEDQARAILASSGTQSGLAAEYGVSASTVQAIKAGRRWRHLQR